MADYQMNMSEEKRPASLIPEGERLVSIVEMSPSVSKSGNNMFVTTIEDVKTKKTMQIWLVSEPKKRWLLKALLSACGLKAGEDGVYEWSVSEVVGKKVVVIVEHIEEEWINRAGETVKTPKAKVVEFREAEKDSTGEPVTTWDEEEKNP